MRFTCVITGRGPSGNTYCINLSLSAKCMAATRLPATFDGEFSPCVACCDNTPPAGEVSKCDYLTALVAAQWLESHWPDLSAASHTCQHKSALIESLISVLRPLRLRLASPPDRIRRCISPGQGSNSRRSRASYHRCR